jgi:hypothetical protein
MIKSDRKDYILSFAILFPTILFMLQQLFLGINLVPHETLRTYNIILSSLPLLYSFNTVINRNLRLILSTYIIFILLLLFSYINYNNRDYIISESFFLLFVSIPVFLSAASVRNIEILKDVLLKVSYIILIIGVILILYILTGKIDFTSYSMSLSYYLLLPTLVFIYQEKITYKFLSVLSLLIILFLGSRGPFIFALFYYAVITLLSIKLNSFKSYLSIGFLFIILILIISVDAINLLSFVENVLGINSRTLNMLISGTIDSDSGRGDIAKIVIDNILNNNLWGYGIYGDRYFLNGTYAHNIFLEVWLDFGIILGTLVLLFLIVFFTKMFLRSNDKKLFLLFFSLGFMPLLVSGTYLGKIEFSILMGFLIIINNRHHKNRISFR